MLRLIISIFVCFLLLVDGLEIIQPPPDSIWVRESGSVELSCQSDQSWQWCYWEMITREGSTNQNTRYQAYQVKLILAFHRVFDIQKYEYTSFKLDSFIYNQGSQTKDNLKVDEDR